MRRVAVAMLVVAAAIVFARPWWAAPLATVLAIAGALILDPPVVRTVLRLAVVLSVLFAAALSGALVALSRGAGRGLAMATSVGLRLVVLVLLAALLARLVDVESIIRVTRRLRLDRLGLVLGLALNVWPHLAVAARDVWCATVIRSRGRGRLALVRAMPRLIEVMLAHTARIAEEAAAAATLRGHSALTSPRQPRQAPRPRVVVVTGRIGSGKTAVVQTLLERRHEVGGRISGLLQVGLWEDGRKLGFEALDVVSGERAELARRVAVGRGQHGTGFRFATEGLELARRALARCQSGDVLVIDELGPLELRGFGHMDAVRKALAVPDLRAAVVVVRRTLVPALLAALEAEDAVVIDVDSSADAVGEVLGCLRTPASPDERA